MVNIDRCFYIFSKMDSGLKKSSKKPIIKGN